MELGELFNDKHKVEKINAGFTNTLYLVDEEYIIKIFKDEERFNRELDFYVHNKNSKFIPRMYGYDISELCIVMEKVEGKSLYGCWSMLSLEERKGVLDKVIYLMRSFHKVKGKPYDWSKYIEGRIKGSLKQCEGIFSDYELGLISFVLNNMSGYLKTSDFRLIHCDIHFGNIIMSGDNIKIIDFESSMYGPIDYELDIFLRMCHNPAKYASEEEERFVNNEDYAMIEPYFKEVYPEIFEIHDFSIRNKIYDLEANLRLLPRFPNDKGLKASVIYDLEELRRKMV